MEDFLFRLRDFLAAIPKPPGTLIMTRVAGSRSFNLHCEESDYDWHGVFVTPLQRLVSLKRRDDEDRVAGPVPNYQFHEIRPFCKLILNGNPDAITALFCNHAVHVTKEWEELLAIRHRFVTRKYVHNCLEYIRGQIHRFRSGLTVNAKSGKPGEKWTYHIVRMAGDVKGVAEGKQLNLWKQGEERDFLLRVRRQEIPLESALAWSEGVIESVAKIGALPLPEEPDVDALDRWLWSVRQKHQ